MKTCFIINYWADTEDKVNMVINLINQIKNTGYDVIYTSLTPIDVRISEICDYNLYHKDNDLITVTDILDHEELQIDSLFSYQTDSFKLHSTSLTYTDVSYSVTKQLIKNLKFLKSIGYDNFHLMVGDCSIHEDEIYVFNQIENMCEFLGKKSYFDDFHDGFSSVYFYSDIEFFLSIFKEPKNKSDFFNNYCNNNRFGYYELILKDFFKGRSEVLLSNNFRTDNRNLSIFKKSKIDLISRYFDDSIKLYIVSNYSDNNKFDLIFVVPNNDEYQIFLDEDLVFDVKNSSGSWFMNTFVKKPIKIKIICNGGIIHNFKLTQNSIDKLCNHTSFYENKK